MDRNKNVLISIIVPIYNVRDYLGRCIESILRQTYRNLEIILVDDGSTDGSGQICDEYAQKDSRIVVIHKENGGVVSARKAGAKAATGDYVIDVDGDDWIGETRIENLVLKGISSGADMIYLNGYHIQWGKEFVLDEPSMQEGYYSADEIRPYLQDTDSCFIRKLFPLMYCWGIKRDLHLRIQMMIDDRIFSSSDLIFFWLCLLEADNVYVMREPSYYYVKRETSITRSSEKRSVKSMPIVYKTIKNGLDRHQCDASMYRRLLFLITRILLEVNYDVFYDQSLPFLYPYSSVKTGSHIIVYGAGLTGIRLMESLSRDDKYSISAWIDQNVRDKEIGGFSPCAPEYIREVDYDFIVIAIQDAAVAQKVKAFLLEMQVEEAKIACMDPAVISQEILESALERIETMTDETKSLKNK